MQGVIMYADLNPGPVTPEWYDDLEEIRLHVIDEKKYDHFQEAEDCLRQVATADGRQRAETGLPVQLDHDAIPTATAGKETEVWGAINSRPSEGGRRPRGRLT